MAINHNLTYLDRILPAVKHRLEQRKQEVSLSLLKTRGTGEPRPSFAAALGGPHLSLIAEVKRASPSAGSIRPQLEVGDVVRKYEEAGADAVSVLTEEDYFRGSLADLVAAAENTSLPILRKDFIVDEYQIYEAKVCGASAVLLIAALLDDAQLRELVQLAFELDLEVLLEVHDRNELERALGFEKVVIGVNNRDLRTFTVSLGTTVDLARLVPPGFLLVAESGIRSRGDLELMAASGVDAVLVGEALLRGANEAGRVREFMQPPLPIVPRGGDGTRKEVCPPAGEHDS